MNRKILTKTTAPLLLAAILISTVAGAFVARYFFTTPATVSITVNDYLGTIYSDQACTIPITTISFGTVIMGDPLSTSILTTPEMYLKLPNLNSLSTAYATWTCDNLPSGMTLTAQYDNNFTGELFSWLSDTLTGEITPSESIFRIKFTLDTGNANQGSYSFDIDVEIGTN